MPAPVLLTVSGTISATLDDEIERGERPRADYRELAAAFDAEVLDHAGAAAAVGRVGRLLGRITGGGMTLALACFRRRRGVDVVFTDSELVGMLFAAMCRTARHRPYHVMIGHRLSPRKKVLFHRLFGVRRGVDHVVVYSASQRDVAVDVLGYRPDEVSLVPFMVDSVFWRADALTTPRRARPMICAAGQELRDYPTLVEAVRDLDVDVVIAAASPWSKRDDSSAGLDIPPNVTVTQLTPFELRQLYADASFVVVPIQETDFQAGITTILEAMSMGRAVVCSRSQGQTDTIVDGETGVYVPPEDARALRSAIQGLVEDPPRAQRLAVSARRWVHQHADIDSYAHHLATLIRDRPGAAR